jgi:hypothetical protein
MMDKELIDQLWNRATRETLNSGALNERYRFAELVADTEAKRIHDEGMVTIGHMREQVAKEREACAKVCEESRHPWGWSAETQDWVGATEHCAAAIRARGEA